MILKVKRNWREIGEEATEVVLECDRYDTRPYRPGDSEAEAAESIFCDSDGEVNPTLTLITFKKEKFSSMLLLGNATVFVMNNEGKTIDTIHS